MGKLRGGGRRAVLWGRSWIRWLIWLAPSLPPGLYTARRVVCICKKLIPTPQVSFGVSPAAAAFAVGLRTPVDHLLLTFFVLCGLTRLARFNITVANLPKDATGKSQYFEGTPIPTSLAIAALMAYWVSQGWILDDLPLGTWAQGTMFEFHPVAGLFVLSGVLMTSKTIHIPKP